MSQDTALKSLQTKDRLSRREIGIIGIHAFIGWALCTASMVISMATTTIQNALIIHAAAAPFIYTAVSLFYFNRFNFTNPLRTGLIFLGFVIFMDFFLVAMIIQKSFEMFLSPMGTWIPFALILSTTYIVGTIVSKRRTAQ